MTKERGDICICQNFYSAKKKFYSAKKTFIKK